MGQVQITKRQLIDILNAWGENKLSTEALQEWMLDHYHPGEVGIAEDEPEEIQEAMHIVMNEYELASQAKMLRSQYQLAVKFINSNQENFIGNRTLFLNNAFTD